MSFIFFYIFRCFVRASQGRPPHSVPFAISFLPITWKWIICLACRNCFMMLFPRDFWRFASMCLFVFIWAGMSTKDLLFALWIGLCSYLIASSKAESAWYKLTTESCNVMTVCTYVFMLNTNLRHINEHQTLIEAVRDAHAINGCFYYFYWTQCLKQEILITFFGYMYLFKGDFHKNMSESNFSHKT